MRRVGMAAELESVGDVDPARWLGRDLPASIACERRCPTALRARHAGCCVAPTDLCVGAAVYAPGYRRRSPTHVIAGCLPPEDRRDRSRRVLVRTRSEPRDDARGRAARGTSAPTGDDLEVVAVEVMRASDTRQAPSLPATIVAGRAGRAQAPR